MPTYEYECLRCGHVFERFQKMTDEPVKRCPECKGKVRRLIGAGAGVLFKGSGFYATDYRSDSYNKGKKAESGAAKESKAAKEPKAEKSSKPADKKE